MLFCEGKKAIIIERLITNNKINIWKIMKIFLKKEKKKKVMIIKQNKFD